MGFELNQNYQGFAEANNVMMEDLQKALSAGYGSDSSAFTGGRSLIPESLDNTLVNVLHSQDEAKLFKALKKEPVSSTVHEYTKRTGVNTLALCQRNLTINKSRELLGTPFGTISSQVVQEWTKGSEHRLNSPERTMKAHECAAPRSGDDICRTAW